MSELTWARQHLPKPLRMTQTKFSNCFKFGKILVRGNCLSPTPSPFPILQVSPNMISSHIQLTTSTALPRLFKGLLDLKTRIFFQSFSVEMGSMLDKSSKVTNCMHFKGEFLGLHDTSGFPNYRTSLQGTRICDNRGGKLKGTQKIMENIYAKRRNTRSFVQFQSSRPNSC